MLHDVDEISIKLNVSKVTIYNKLKLKELKAYIVKKQGKSFVDEDGFNLIKDSLNIKSSIKNSVKNDNVMNSANEEVAMDNEYLINLKDSLIDTLNSDIEFLRREIIAKNIQLESKDKLIENMQVLLKQEQDKEKQKELFALETHFKELDFKLSEIKTEMQQRKNRNTLFNFFKKE